MSNTGFTIGYNCILRDKSLSLTAKGLYLVISSYVGMPDWALTKRELAKVCGTRHGVSCLPPVISNIILRAHLPVRLFIVMS